MFKKLQIRLNGCYLSLVLISLISIYSCDNRKTTSQAQKTVKTEDTVYQSLTNGPNYKGGYQAMSEYLRESIAYPDGLDTIQGKVLFTFVVDKEGNTRDVELVDGIHPKLDQQALRAVKGMNNWHPGKKNGEPVDASMKLPINLSPELINKN